MTRQPHRYPSVTGYTPRLETKTRKQVSSASAEVRTKRSVTSRSHTTNSLLRKGSSVVVVDPGLSSSGVYVEYHDSMISVRSQECLATRLPDLYLRSEVYANGGIVLVLTNMAKVSLPSTPEPKLKKTCCRNHTLHRGFSTLSIDST